MAVPCRRLAVLSDEFKRPQQHGGEDRVFRAIERCAADHLAEPDPGHLVVGRHIFLLLHQLLELLAHCAQLEFFPIVVHSLQSMCAVGSSGQFGILPECGFSNANIST
jgi:hypothetical protein